MSPELGVIIMMNNYFHDVATALLVASGVALWVMVKHLEAEPPEAVGRYFLRLHRSLTRLAQLSLVWIVVGGVPRTVFYVDFEWANAAGRAQIPALIVKHVIVFALVGAGVALWAKLRARVRALERRASVA